MSETAMPLQQYVEELIKNQDYVKLTEMGINLTHEVENTNAILELIKKALRESDEEEIEGNNGKVLISYPKASFNKTIFKNYLKKEKLKGVFKTITKQEIDPEATIEKLNQDGVEINEEDFIVPGTPRISFKGDNE